MCECLFSMGIPARYPKNFFVPLLFFVLAHPNNSSLCYIPGFAVHLHVSVCFWHPQLHALPAHVAWPKPMIGQFVICCYIP